MQPNELHEWLSEHGYHAKLNAKFHSIDIYDNNRKRVAILKQIELHDADTIEKAKDLIKSKLKIDD